LLCKFHISVPFHFRIIFSIDCVVDSTDNRVYGYCVKVLSVSDEDEVELVDDDDDEILVSSSDSAAGSDDDDDDDDVKDLLVNVKRELTLESCEDVVGDQMSTRTRDDDDDDDDDEDVLASTHGLYLECFNLLLIHWVTSFFDLAFR